MARSNGKHDAEKENISTADTNRQMLKPANFSTPRASLLNGMKEVVEQKTLVQKRPVDTQTDHGKMHKRPKTSNVSASNFLLTQAKRSKAAKSAQKRARAGVDRVTKNQVSYSGSGVPLKQVLRLRYVKGFTQAVRVPCQAEDIL